MTTDTDSSRGEALKLRAKQATEARFLTRLASEDQRNGYEVGYYEALVATAQTEGSGLAEDIRRLEMALKRAREQRRNTVPVTITHADRLLTALGRPAQ